MVKPSDDAFLFYHWCQCKKTLDDYDKRSDDGGVQLAKGLFRPTEENPSRLICCIYSAVDI